MTSDGPARAADPADPEATRRRYTEVRARLARLLEGEDDWIAALATTACELHTTFEHFDWTGFYRVTRPGWLVVGPYQGAHGCLRIPFSRGICGAAARTRRTQRIDDVSLAADHIACSSTTRSEIVVPLVARGDRLLAVLDVDSDRLGAFGEVDQAELEAICGDLAARFPGGDVDKPVL
jgi:L-methionine (R)-S-oxide reductase